MINITRGKLLYKNYCLKCDKMSGSCKNSRRKFRLKHADCKVTLLHSLYCPTCKKDSGCNANSRQQFRDQHALCGLKRRRNYR